MCGIAGIISFSPQHRVARETLAKMSQCIAHRGPDGEGLWLNHEDEPSPDRPQVGLVHRRLAILDPDPRSDQPFADGRGRWITFNGEIYNFRELRKELESLLPDYEWRTTGDTEVLLASYAAWGEKCVEHLNGMFAFAVWDENAKSLFLARDRMGQKPLYFAAMPGSKAEGFTAIVFASETTALRPVKWISFDFERASLLTYLRYGYVPAPYTFFDGVTQFMPGMYLSTRRQSGNGATVLEAQHCTDWNANPSLSTAEAVQATQKWVEIAAKRQVVSDVPLGCFLSGGIDSSVITAAAQRSIGRPVHTFTIGFQDAAYDERSFAAAVAKHLGTVHHEAIVQPDAARDLPKLAAVFGEPFGDSSALPTHYLAQFARQHVKVALSGDGGDELFGGYERYRAFELSNRFAGKPIARTAARIADRLPGSHPKGIGSRAKRFLGSLDQPPAERYLSYVRIFSPSEINSLWPTERRTPMAWDDDYPSRLGKLLDKRRDASALTAFDRVTYLPGDLLTKVDRASMLHALEVRAPFMDHELVQFAAGLTTDQLLRGGGKRMLREAFAADLPAWVFKRKKMGFAVPIGEWFRGPLRAMLHEHLFAADSFASGYFNLPFVRQMVEQHEAKTVDHSQRLYALLMLELWWRGQTRFP